MTTGPRAIPDTSNDYRAIVVGVGMQPLEYFK